MGNSLPGCLLTVSRLWVGLGVDLGGQKIYLGRYDIITSCPPFSAFKRGQDGMDWDGVLWMMCSINRTSSLLDWALIFVVGPVGHSNLHAKKYI